MKKAIIIISGLAVVGGGVYLYLMYKKKKSATNTTGTGIDKLFSNLDNLPVTTSPPKIDKLTNPVTNNPVNDPILNSAPINSGVNQTSPTVAVDPNYTKAMELFVKIRTHRPTKLLTSSSMFGTTNQSISAAMDAMILEKYHTELRNLGYIYDPSGLIKIN